MNQPREYGLILLAAGSSSRMGQSKQLLEINGEPLLRHMSRIAVASAASHIVVVLGSEKERHKTVISDLPVEIIDNPDWKKGMGNSMKAGLRRALSKKPSIAGVVVLVCDQPNVSKKLIDDIISTHERTGKPLVGSQYTETIGVPAFFGKEYFQHLASLDDSQGAKQILLQNPADLTVVDFPGGNIDLDTLNDYRNYLNLT